MVAQIFLLGKKQTHTKVGKIRLIIYINKTFNDAIIVNVF